MHVFDRDTELSEKGPFVLSGTISDRWSINDVPNGGYMMAIMANAMMHYSEKKGTPIVTVNYMAKCRPGEIEVRVKGLSSSRQFDRYEAKLYQDGEERIHSIGTFAEILDCSLVRYEGGPPEVQGPDACVMIPRMPRYTLYDHMDVRLDPSCAGWFQGKLSGISEHKGWIRFKEERPHDLLSIMLMADSFPPPILSSQGLSAWVPTIELSVNIRNVPSAKLLRCLFRTRYVNCGLLEEDGEVWDEEGELVAISRQIAQFRKL